MAGLASTAVLAYADSCFMYICVTVTEY